MGRKLLRAAVILAVSEAHSPIDDGQSVRCLARQLIEYIIAGRLDPVAFVHEPGDPGRIDGWVGNAHPNSSFRHAVASVGTDTVLFWSTVSSVANPLRSGGTTDRG